MIPSSRLSMPEFRSYSSSASLISPLSPTKSSISYIFLSLSPWSTTFCSIWETFGASGTEFPSYFFSLLPFIFVSYWVAVFSTGLLSIISNFYSPIISNHKYCSIILFPSIVFTCVFSERFERETLHFWMDFDWRHRTDCFGWYASLKADI